MPPSNHLRSGFEYGRHGFLGIAAIFVFFVLLYAARDVGITWDEPIYLQKAVAVEKNFKETLVLFAKGEWNRAFQRFWDDPVWAWHPEIPQLPRVLQGITGFFSSWMLGEPWAQRAASALAWCVAWVTVVILAWRFWGEKGMWFSACAYLGMPRLVGHGTIAASESTLIATWFLTAYFFYKAWKKETSVAWVGLAWGLALASKFQAVVLLPILSAWSFLYAPWRAVRLFTIAFPIGLGTACLVQPYYWTEPIKKFHYLWIFYTQHFPIPLWYLQERYSGHAPWHYAWIMCFAITPLPIVLAALGGLSRAIFSLKEKWTFVAALALSPLILMMLPQAATYDGERLFVMALPAWALLAGGCSAEIFQKYGWKLNSIIKGIAVFAVAGMWVWTHPFYLAYYGGVVGGPKGALKLGLESSYWLDALTPWFLKQMNEKLPPGARVQCVSVQLDVLKYAQDRGWLRRDLSFTADAKDATYLLIYRRQGFISDEAYQNYPPLLEVRYRGISLVKLVRLEQAA